MLDMQGRLCLDDGITLSASVYVQLTPITSDTVNRPQVLADTSASPK